MAKNKTILKNIKIPMFGLCLTVLVGKTIEEAISISYNLKDFKLDEDDKEAQALYFGPELCDSHIVVFTHKTLSINSITHECYHATIGMLRSIDTELCDETEEVFSYFNAYLVEKVCKAVKLSM